MERNELDTVINAPLDPQAFYNHDTPTVRGATASPPALYSNGPGSTGRSFGAVESASRSSSRQASRSVSSPVQGSGRTLNSVRSNPVLLPSRAPGNVKDLAKRIEQGAGSCAPQLAVRPAPEGNKRTPGYKSARPKSPVKSAATRSEPGMAKLQKRRPGQPKSPVRSPGTSFETAGSFISNSTATSTRNQPPSAIDGRKPRSSDKQALYMGARPLFGEITADGWHGNFALSNYREDLSSYGPLPTFQPARRRQSESGLALGHGRSQSHQNFQKPALSPPPSQALHHKRSRSDMDALRPLPAPSMPNLHSQHIPALYPTPPDSGSRHPMRIDSPTSRIPVSRRRQSQESAGKPEPVYSRSASAMSNPAGRRRLSKSPSRRPAPGKENSTPTSIPRSRYQPPSLPIVHNQTLSAKIVAPLPQKSPPLRSSRPRQPVSSATTSASRARAADRFQSPVPKDGKRPSEQWLGKPYDPQKERSRRRIPELQKVDFAERRARIQKAISQSLEETTSQESLRSRSRKGSVEGSMEATAGAEVREHRSVDQNQADEINREKEAIGADEARTANARPRELNLDTTRAAEHIPREPEPTTAATEFEVDDAESPVLGRPTSRSAQMSVPEAPTPAEDKEESPMLLSSATYTPSTTQLDALPAIVSTISEEPNEVRSPTLLDNVMRMREMNGSPRSREGTEFTDDSPRVDDSPSDIEDRWGIGHSLVGDQGSIRIMLDDAPATPQQSEPWSKNVEEIIDHVRHQTQQDIEAQRNAQEVNHHALTSNGFTESPVDKQHIFADEAVQDTPQQHQPRNDTLQPSTYHPAYTSDNGTECAADNEDDMGRAISQYQTTGSVDPELLRYLQTRSVDLQRISANGGSDAMMVQNLLDSMFHIQDATPNVTSERGGEMLLPNHYEVPAVTPDTPSDVDVGTAVVYKKDDDYIDTLHDADFEAKIRKADEEWERQQRGEEAVLGAQEDEDRPTPPPKDVGYTPRSSTGPSSATVPPSCNDGLRISTSGEYGLPVIDPARDLSESASPANERQHAQTHAPPHPVHAPPPPPSPLHPARLPFATSEASYSDRGSSEMSARLRKNLWDPSGSSRPSTDSQLPMGPPSLPGGQSNSSLAESVQHHSVDTSTDNQAHLVKTLSPGPEQKRLMKRRHIVKELLDTENTYHQDLKIIEDIYKATVADLVTAEDKKTLFGNCDDIERFSLFFYDELRKAVTTVYVPPKQMRWANKRGSYSTMQSDGTGQTTAMSTEAVDEEKDRATTIGQCFLQNLPRMDQVYGAYLKNHDAANQRLSALKNTPTVKCWLDECHNNASDITSAWDLDSLLVKPTQRVSKYPMLLQQLLETTPPGHPDHDPIKAAVKDSIGMLTRINEAKKRADIVDQIINRKGKDTDVRSGIAKAFGRRTEKLKERVGIAEAFQDAEFDMLSHKFGGHFIRLQICMRDVQDYVHRIDKTMDQIINCAASLETFADVSQSSLPEIESKWRKYGQAIREISSVAFPDHKTAVQKRIIQPMVTCIKLHDGPQNAINKRKRRIVDYAKCKSIEKRGEKPDKKTLEASEMYEALNDQLKIELPKLYSLTADLVQACLNCFLEIQQKWYHMWERKLKPILEAADIPTSLQQIEPAFRPDYELVKHKLVELSICNGALLADSANFLSPTQTLVDSSENSSLKRPSTLDGSKRTLSVGSESSPIPPTLAKRHSNGYMHGHDGLIPPYEGRIRSNSSISTRGIPALQNRDSSMSASRQWSSSNTPTSSFSTSRPATANPPSVQYPTYQSMRQSADNARSPRPTSQQTYFTAQPDRHSARSSGIFNSAMPPNDFVDLSKRPTSPHPLLDETSTMFVCASLFEFSIDKTRKEAGYPYLTYVQGEVFDVVAQKGELWLAKNQDDMTNTLGWIWEQHFVILSQN